MTLLVAARIERWPIAGTFVISRGAVTEVAVVVAEVIDGAVAGRGECRPYPRYGETPESVVGAIEAANLQSTDRRALQSRLPPGAARNALDCALWDLAAKRDRAPVWRSAGLTEPRPLTTAFTLSLGAPEAMASAAREGDWPVLKLKLGGDDDPDRIRAVRASAPDARLIVDANEAWSERNFAENMRACAEARVELVEQPLPADSDGLLREAERSVPVYADESVHVAADLAALAGKYDGVNIKLDKAGGLTEALKLLREARGVGFGTMVGCMVSTSLAVAPAVLLAQEADYVDLDGPILLRRDRQPALRYSGALVAPPDPIVWG
jgi:L-alanine-DL-glutamate epimerase-like enolase superfamily enzyme